MTTLTLFYEDGVFKPLEAVTVPDRSTVKVDITEISKETPSALDISTLPPELQGYAAAGLDPLDFLHELAVDDPDLPSDLSENLDHYLYGLPKCTDDNVKNDEGN